MKVSVIVPVYGVEKYIARCAESLFEQTMEEGIEFIFIDDCSPDRSIEVLKEVLERYPNRKGQTRIERMPTNSGLPAVRRHGIELAKGEYIIHCDSDDWVDKEMYEVMYNKAKEDDLDCVYCGCVREKYDGKSDIWPYYNYVDRKTLIADVCNRHFYLGLVEVLVRKSIYENNNILYPIGNMHEDVVLLLQIFYYSRRGCGSIKRPFYHYYQNNESITQGQKDVESKLKIVEGAKKNVSIIEEFLKGKDDILHKNSLITNMKIHVRQDIIGLRKSKDFKKLWKSIYPELKGYKILLDKNIPNSQKRVYFLLGWGLWDNYLYIKSILGF